MVQVIDPQARSEEEARRLSEERRRLEEAEDGPPTAEPEPTRGDPDEEALREARRRVENDE